MQEEKYRRPLLCRLCKGPVLDRGVLVHGRRDMDKLRRWWKAQLDTEYTKKQCRVCYFCAWDLRFADEHSDEKVPLDQVWWPPYKRNLLSNKASSYYPYYSEELTKPFSVKITLISPEPLLEEENLQKGVGQTHRCIYCPKVFNSIHRFFKHIKNAHSDAQVINCGFKLCRKFFQTEEEKLEHQKKEHSKPKSSIKCIYCGKVSTNKFTHRGHLRYHHQGQVIRCKILACTLIFKTEEERDAHFDKKHNFGKYFCCFCDRYFEMNSMQLDHMKKYHKEALRCNVVLNCPNYFKTEEDRQKHVLEKHPSAKKYKCVYCEKNFPAKMHLGYHMKRVHDGATAIKCEIKKCITFFKTEEERQKHLDKVHGKDKFFCVYCDKTIYNKNGIASHLKIHHSAEEIIRCSYNQCATYFKSEEEKAAHTKEAHQSSENKYCCIYCNKFLVKRPGGIKSHMQTFHPDVFIKCTYQCTFYFKTLEDRDKHIKKKHQAEKIRTPTQCLYCDTILRDVVAFRLHVKTRHQDVAIKCTFTNCGLYFNSQGDLENHFKHKPKHNLSNLMKCLLCEKKYSSKESLSQHSQFAHEGKERKKCPHCRVARSKMHVALNIFCRVCNQKFACWGLMKQHCRLCKRLFRCPVCAKVVKTKMELTSHCVSNHTAHVQQWRGLQFKSRGIKCDECCTYYKLKNSLALHFKNVHSALLLTCHFCNMKFVKKIVLLQHIERKHI